MENMPQSKHNTRLVLAVALIAIGGLWILKELGFYIDFQPYFYDNFLHPINRFFRHIFDAIFSWPMILIIVGAILLAGKRSGGLVLLIIGAIFLLPKLFFFNGITATILLPLLLIGVGVAMVIRVI